MRIAYCTNVRLPSERAHGHQIAQVSDALVHLGHEVEIFAPYRENIVREDYYTYYGAEQDVRITHLGKKDFIKSILTPGVIGLFFMNAMLRRELPAALEEGSFELLYTRTRAILPTLLATGIPTVLELHQLPLRSRRIFVKDCNRCARVVCLTSAMRTTLIKWGVNPEKITVEGDAVDLRRFENLPSQPKLRGKFFLETDRMIIGYIGRLRTLKMEKGVSTILQALALLKEKSAFFGFIVGGPEEDRGFYESLAKKLKLTETDVKFSGEITPALVPSSMAACDVLAMPFPDLPHYRSNMSPLKMFEYMAAGRPIITSDLPTIRDVLSEETAIFCKPGDTESFKEALLWVATHREEAEKRAENALALVKRHSWEERMKRILSSVGA